MNNLIRKRIVCMYITSVYVIIIHTSICFNHSRYYPDKDIVNIWFFKSNVPANRIQFRRKIEQNRFHLRNFSRLFPETKMEAISATERRTDCKVWTRYYYPTRYYPIMLFVESRFQTKTQFHARSMARLPSSLTHYVFQLATPSHIIVAPFLLLFFNFQTGNVFAVRWLSTTVSRVFIINRIKEEAKRGEKAWGTRRTGTGHRLFHVISPSQSNDRTKFRGGAVVRI